MMTMKLTGQYLIAAMICLLGATGCSTNMQNQARAEPFEPNEFFAYDQSARQLPPHTIPYEPRVEQEGFYTGRTADDGFVDTNPLPATEAVIAQGQTQYNIFCKPCHGQTGAGDGIIVERGFPPPPSFYSDRLRQAPDGHYFFVITNGLGEMFGYGQRVPPEARWAIIAYIRELQSNQAAAPAEEPAETDAESQDRNDE